jgi:hypothetical protein
VEHTYYPGKSHLVQEVQHMQLAVFFGGWGQYEQVAVQRIIERREHIFVLVSMNCCLSWLYSYTCIGGFLPYDRNTVTLFQL